MDEFDSTFGQRGDKSENDEIEDMELTKERLVLNPISVRDRIDNNLESLSNFKARKDKSQSRSEIISNLSRDLSEYYGYLPELSEFFLDLFSPNECVEFMDASDRPRPLVIRSNSLKVTRKDLIDSLSKRGSVVEPVDWSKVAIKVTESSVPIGATPEYLAGHYMLQSASSLNPVMALDPQPGERILDMSAAPGGKTSYIAQLMKNTGSLIANDLKAQRQKATIANLHRLGVKNATVCCYDGRKIPHIMKGFDRVLLDAPCSGLGVISRDQSVKLQRTMKDVARIAHLQKELLCAAVDVVDPKSPSGGIIVYSTCSITPEENEQVVQYILSKRYVRLIDSGLEVGKPGLTRYREKRFHPSLALTRRFYPHVHNMDGFYVAKFQKYKNGPRGGGDDDEEEGDEGEEDGGEDDDSEGEEGGDIGDFEFVDEHGVVKMNPDEEGREEEVEKKEEEEDQEEEEEVIPEPEPVKVNKKKSKPTTTDPDQVLSPPTKGKKNKSAPVPEPEPTPESEPAASPESSEEAPKKRKKKALKSQPEPEPETALEPEPEPQPEPIEEDIAEEPESTPKKKGLKKTAGKKKVLRSR